MTTTATPAGEFTFNLGVPKADYDRATGIHRNFGPGIYEFRIGDEVENIHNGKRHVIAALYPRQNESYTRSPCTVEVERGRHCCVLVVRPTNPERIKFGYIVRTVGETNGVIHGGASRHATRESAKREVERLTAANYPGVIQILDRE